MLQRIYLFVSNHQNIEFSGTARYDEMHFNKVQNEKNYLSIKNTFKEKNIV